MSEGQKQQHKKQKSFFGSLKDKLLGASLDGLHKSQITPGLFVSEQAIKLGQFGFFTKEEPPNFICFDASRKLCALTTTKGLVRVYGAHGTETSFLVPQENGPVRGLFFFGTEGFISIICQFGVHIFSTVPQPKLKGSTTIEDECASYDSIFGDENEFALIGTKKGDLIAIDLILVNVSLKTVKYSQIASRETTSGPPLSIVRINPMCPSIVLLYHGTPLKMLTTWNLVDDKLVHVYNLKEYQQITDMRWHHKGDRFITLHEDGIICIWKFKEDKKPKSTFPISIISNSPSPNKIIRPIKISLTKRGKEDIITVIGGNNDETKPSSSLLIISGSKDSPTKLKRSESLCNSAVDFSYMFRGPRPFQSKDPIVLLSISSNGRFVVNSMKENSFQPIELNTVPYLFSHFELTCIRTFENTQFPFLHSQSTSLILTGHANGSVYVWDFTNGGMNFITSCSSSRNLPIKYIEFDTEKGILTFGSVSELTIVEWSSEPKSREIINFPLKMDNPAENEKNETASTSTSEPTSTTNQKQTLFPAGFQTIAEITLQFISCVTLSFNGNWVACGLGQSGEGGILVLNYQTKNSFVISLPENRIVSAAKFIERISNRAKLIIGANDGSIWSIEVNENQSQSQISSLIRCLDSGSSGFIVNFILIDQNANTISQPITKEEVDTNRQFVVTIQKSCVCVYEIQWDPFLFSEVRKTPKCRSPIISASLITHEKGNGVLVVDESLDIHIYSLIQCQEISKISLLSSYFAIPNEGFTNSTIQLSQTGKIFIGSPSTISVSSIFNHAPIQVLELAEPFREEQPPSKSLSQIWSSLGMPSGTLHDIFFIPVPTGDQKPTTSQSEREQLLGTSNVANSSQNKETTSSNSNISTTNVEVSSAIGSVSQARDALIERGEKLEKMAEKTGDLANHASSFAELCHELAKRQ